MKKEETKKERKRKENIEHISNHVDHMISLFQTAIVEFEDRVISMKKTGEYRHVSNIINVVNNCYFNLQLDTLTRRIINDLDNEKLIFEERNKEQNKNHNDD